MNIWRKKTISALLAIFSGTSLLVAQTGATQEAKAQDPYLLGHWIVDTTGLPCFNYTASLPFAALQKNGEKLKALPDPPFLLGNCKLNLFVHVSGIYDFVSGERHWLRLNQPEVPNYGENHAEIEIPGDHSSTKIALTGLDSISADPARTRRYFGTGYAVFQYKPNDKVECQRIMSVKPSSTPYDGISAFVLTVKLKNTSEKIIKLSYTESVLARCRQISMQNIPEHKWPFHYVNHITLDPNLNIIKNDVGVTRADPLSLENPATPSPYDGFPPSLFMKVEAAAGLDSATLTHETNSAGFDTLSAKYALQLKPSEEKVFRLIIGYSYEPQFRRINALCHELEGVESEVVCASNVCATALFRQAWKAKLPDLHDEPDPILRREMVWNAYCLEAMANYNSYYKETQVPQGTHYAYAWGVNGSARDQYQIGLALCYIDPALARSNLKYMMERTTPWGEIRLEETGFGMAGDDWFTPSDQQLWYFMLLSEYLRITHDYKFLLEEVSYYPLNESPRANSIEMIERCFKYLRDDVGLGGHNLVHMRYSDWNDEGFFLFNASYVRYWTTAESYLNSAMVASIFPGFIEQLNKARDMPAFSRQKARLDTLTRSMNLYAQTVTSAFLEGLDDRNFSIRCRMDDKLIGDDFMFLEPQSFALQIPSLDPQKKAAIFHEVKSRLIDGEVMGARLCEKYLPNSFGEPMFATGLFWWAMNGPLIIGVSSFDKPAAWELLHKMTFDNHVRHFPTYWEGYWTASDALGASVMPFEGSCPSDFPAFCGHAHAWPLYCYFKLKDK